MLSEDECAVLSLVNDDGWWFGVELLGEMRNAFKMVFWSEVKPKDHQGTTSPNFLSPHYRSS